MKKVFALLSSLLVFAGVKAQTPTTPAVKKETVKPLPVKPALDSAVVKPGTTIKQTDKAIKFDHIKKEVPVKMKEMKEMKESPVAKPHKY